MRSKLWVAFTGLVLLIACPGRLADPSEFLDGGGGGDGGMGGGSGGGGGSDGGCNAETDIFQLKCAGSTCHSPPAASAGGLDLISPGVKQRLAGNSTCNGGVPYKTYLINKVTMATPLCGAQMPLAAAPLSAAEVQCLQAYVDTIDGGP